MSGRSPGSRFGSWWFELFRVERFVDEYDDVARLTGSTPGRIRKRDAESDGSPLRWLARNGRAIVGVADGLIRPDDRLFLRFDVSDPGVYGPLTEWIYQEQRRPLFAMADEQPSQELQALKSIGFRTEVVNERFIVSFDDVLAKLVRAWVPSAYVLRRADRVDEERLFRLDNDIRSLVPGSDGWRGNRRWFSEELAESPPFEPNAYLVAVHVADDEYVGLIRIWRNEARPRLGLIGVLPQHRVPSLAAALLRAGLLGAAQWGHEVFETETSLENPHTYKRLARLATESGGRFRQLVYDR